jgi:hypothetical protein
VTGGGQQRLVRAVRSSFPGGDHRRGVLFALGAQVFRLGGTNTHAHRAPLRRFGADHFAIRLRPRPTTPPRPRPAAMCRERAGYATRMTGLGRPA